MYYEQLKSDIEQLFSKLQSRITDAINRNKKNPEDALERVNSLIKNDLIFYSRSMLSTLYKNLSENYKKDASKEKLHSYYSVDIFKEMQKKFVFNNTVSIQSHAVSPFFVSSLSGLISGTVIGGIAKLGLNSTLTPCLLGVCTATIIGLLLYSKIIPEYNITRLSNCVNAQLDEIKKDYTDIFKNAEIWFQNRVNSL